MGSLIMYPAARPAATDRAPSRTRRASSATIIILPVVRIERDPGAPASAAASSTSPPPRKRKRRASRS